MSCQAIVKSTGIACKNKARLDLADGTFCGVHAPKPPKTQDAASPSPSPKKTKKINKSEYEEIYECILKRLDENMERIDLDETDITLVRNLKNGNEERFECVMKCAVGKSGSTTENIDYPSIANQIPMLMRYYEETSTEKYKKIDREFTNPTIPAYIQSFMPRRENSIAIVNEFGNAIAYSDSDIMIMNCASHYTGMSLSSWCKNPENIYMGPKKSVFFEKKVEPEEDSEWFIPYKEEHETRYISNKFWIKKILEDIEKGEDTAEKYLALRGKTLGCVCMPNPCHCTVYAEVVSELLKRPLKEDDIEVEIEVKSE
jgi:hypothetical protein